MGNQQLLLGFTSLPSYAAQDFVLSSSNQAAYQWIDAWPAWNIAGLVLTGPQGCGKTHLCHILRQKSQGQIFNFADLEEELLEVLPSLPQVVIVEDCHKWTLEKETLLFHLYNHLFKHKGHLILTACSSLVQWPLSLEDFKSRLKTLAEVHIQDPDDDVLLAILMKRFADHQIKVDFKITEFLIKRLPRTYAHLHQVIDEVLKKASQQKKGITIPFLKSVLADLT